MRGSMKWRLCGALSIGVLAIAGVEAGPAAIAGAGGTNPVVVSASFAPGAVGVPYNGGTLSISGGSGKYTVTATGLPPGLSKLVDGLEHSHETVEYATTAGAYSVSITATDTEKPPEVPPANRTLGYAACC